MTITIADGRTELWQWDTGRTLAVDADCSQVHFSNKVFGRSIDVDVVDGAAIIPDILLQTDKELNVWAFVGTAENGYTKISKTFKVNRRNKPADYVFTPTDQMTLQTIQRQIGDLADLTTEAKENLVAAINEMAAEIPTVDSTLTQPGQPADAAAVGDRLSVLSEEIADLPQSDWDQNDVMQPDYVKNRPFYTGAPVETVVVEDSTVSFTRNEHSGFYSAILQSTFVPTVGDIYKVSWDGTAYECTCVDSNGNTIIGNLSIVGAGSDTGEPFIVGVIKGVGIQIATADTSASHAISISELVREIVKIDAKYLPFPFKPDGISYLTFSSRNSFSLSIREKSWDGTLEYFASNGTWTVLDGASSLSAEANGSEYVLYLRGTGNTVISGGLEWNLEGFDISCIGNIETLLDYATVESGGHPAMAEGCYQGMFQGCTSLTRAPELPATTLAKSCYDFMFQGCTNLIQAPELPATTLASYCYQGMFSDCTSLTQAPELSATALASYCYYMMFSGCTSLTQVSELPATTLANGCYYMMFYGCTSITRAPTLSATILASECYYSMFFGCTSLTQVSELPATALANLCYYRMFYGCTSLKLSETKTEEYTQEYRIPLSGDGTDASSALAEMFISTGGTFIGTPSINTTYYLSSDNMIARGNDIDNLHGYVKSMIDSAGECIPAPATAQVGQAIVVKAVDENGKPTAWEAVDMPDALPNPNALTFTGAVTGSYDGSAPLSVEIPLKLGQFKNDVGYLTLGTLPIYDGSVIAE